MTNWNILEEHWQELAAQTILDPTVYQEIFREIKRKYSYGSSVKRVYHSPEKLVAMLQLAEKYHNEQLNMRVIKYAIWFSMLDATIIQSKDLSPNYKLASKLLSRIGVPEIELNHVRNCIDALVNTTETLTPEMALFLDIYNLDLGKNHNNYLSSIEEIKQELSFTERFGFKKRYRKWLETVINPNKIFKTEAINTQFESQAQKNLALVWN